MYLRTPKRYTKQKRNVISLRWAWLWLLTGVIVLAGKYLYDNRDLYGPPIQAVVSTAVAGAQRDLATAVASTPLPTENPTERIALANSAWSGGRIEEALNIYEEIAPLAPNDVTVHYRMTLGLIMEGQLDNALVAAERAVTANPFSADTWAIRAMALDWAERYGEAIASALHALDLEPNNARALAFLAEAYNDSGQPERALETVEQALEIDPESFEAYRVRGLITQESLFDFEAAKADFRQAYELAPNMTYIAIDLAWMEYSLQNHDQAVEMLQEVIELNPQNTEALYTLGFFIYSAYGDPNQASEYISRCLEANPESIACHNYMGLIQTGLQQYSAAAESFERVIALGTTEPIHYLRAGRSYMTLGDCSSALPLLQRGYALAQETENAEQIAELETAMAECQFGPAFEATPEVTEEPTS